MTFTTQRITSETRLARFIRSLPAINRFVVTNIKVLGIGALIVGMFVFLAPRTKKAEAAKYFVKSMYLTVGVFFWSRGYFVRTVGIDEEIVKKYVQEQWKRDQLFDGPQLDLRWE